MQDPFQSPIKFCLQFVVGVKAQWHELPRIITRQLKTDYAGVFVLSDTYAL